LKSWGGRTRGPVALAKKGLSTLKSKSIGVRVLSQAALTSRPPEICSLNVFRPVSRVHRLSHLPPLTHKPPRRFTRGHNTSPFQDGAWHLSLLVVCDSTRPFRLLPCRRCVPRGAPPPSRVVTQPSVVWRERSSTLSPAPPSRGCPGPSCGNPRWTKIGLIESSKK